MKNDIKAKVHTEELRWESPQVKLKTALSRRFNLLVLIFTFSILIFSLAPAAQAIDVPGWPIVPCGLNAQPKDSAGNELPKTGPDAYDYTKACGRCDLFKLLKNLIDFTVGALMPAVAILLFVWAGFLILLGGANTNLVAQGRQIFSTTFFVILIMLSAWMITNTLIKSIGSNYDNADNWWQFTCVERVPATPPPVTQIPT